MTPFGAHHALAALLPPWTTSVDTRVAARATPLTAAAIEAVRDILHSDIQPLLYTLSSPSSRHFKLALSALLASIDVSFTALLSDQRSDNDFTTRQTWSLFLYIVAWHHLVLNSSLITTAWGHSGGRVDIIVSSLAGILHTLTPDASRSLSPPRALHISQFGDERPARTAVFLRRVQLALPDLAALHRQIAIINIVKFSLDETTILFPTHDAEPESTADTSHWDLPPRHELDHAITITTRQGIATRLSCAASLAPLRLPVVRGSRFLPPELNWAESAPSEHTDDRVPQREASPPPWFRARLSPSPPRHSRSTSGRTVVRTIPTFHVTSVISKRTVWHRRFKRYLGQAVRVILDGKLCLPLDHHEGPPLDAANLPSCFAHPDHTRFVDNIISEYLVTGVCSWYPPSAKPVVICPLGVVPKKTEPFFRLVIDARGPNLRMSRWASNMRSLASSAHIFQPGSVVWTRDIGKAYIVSAFQGCTQRFTPRVRADGFRYQHVGCEPDNCNLTCSKCLLGFRWRHQNLVFNAPMFGGKTSGNVLDTLLGPVDRWIRTKGISHLRWVDDLCMSLPPRPAYRHDTTHCGGIGMCFMCNDTHRRAMRLMTELDNLLIELGFQLNDKLTMPSQRGEFIGLGWDTLRCCFWMPAAKANHLAGVADAIVESSAASRRDLAKFRGKLSWYAPCLSGVRLLLREINAFIGNPASDTEWDAVVPVSSAALLELQHWGSVLPTAADHEKPLWTLRPAQALELYRLGCPVVSVYMETDASLDGWGCTLRVNHAGTWTDHHTSVSWAPGQPVTQVQCEGEALHQALLTFLPLVRGCAVLHVTDCKPTLDLPDRGSASSRQLQQTAKDIWLFCSTHGILLYSAWIPGADMIKSGTDALSREALIDPHCASVRPAGWLAILDLARRHDRTPTIDWFADSINHQLPSYWSRYPTPDSAGSDALSAPSWNHTRCNLCDVTRVTYGYFFPPVPLLDSFIAKARVDQASGVLVCPRIVSALWWPVLVSAAISNFVRLPSSSLNFDRQHCDRHLSNLPWNIVVFDFSPLPRAALPSPACKCLLDPRNDNAHLSSRAQLLRDQHSRLAQALLGQ
jgi:hypothetical protein